MEGPESRVDFGMAEALAFGALALHRGARPPHALRVAQQAPAGDDLRTAAQRGERPSSAPPQCCPLLVRTQREAMTVEACLLGMAVGSVRMQRRMRRPA